MKSQWLVAAVCAALVASAAQAETVRITNIGHGYYAGPLYVAVHEKLFQKYGLEPEITVVQGGSLALQTVLTKQADVGVLSYEHVLTAAAQGKRIVSFFNIANRPVNNVIVDNELFKGSEGLDVEAKMRRLKGHRVALPSAGGSGEKMLRVLARKFGMELPGDISTVYLGSEPGSYVAAFQRNLVDAALPVEPAGVLVQQAGQGRIYINLMAGEVPEFSDILFMTLTAHPDSIKGKPDLLRKVAAVFTDAARLLKSDPKRGEAIMAQEYPNLSAEANASTFATMNAIWSVDGRMTEAQAKAVHAYLQPEGSAPIDFPQTFTNEFLAQK